MGHLEGEEAPEAISFLSWEGLAGVLTGMLQVSVGGWPLGFAPAVPRSRRVQPGMGHLEGSAVSEVASESRWQQAKQTQTGVRESNDRFFYEVRSRRCLGVVKPEMSVRSSRIVSACVHN
eukprot:1190863-Prorocentrum_minimum.AAC.1